MFPNGKFLHITRFTSKTVIAKSSAHWCGNPFSHCTTIRNQMRFGDADCHVAAFMAAPRNDMLKYASRLDPMAQAAIAYFSSHSLIWLAFS